jgi:putative membrane protein
MIKTIKKITNKHLVAERVNRFWLVYYSVGLAGFILPVTRDLFMSLTGLTIIMSTILMLWFHKPWNNRFIFASSTVFAGGILIEALGVNSGMIFGTYHYGDILGPKIMKTPILIGLNWLMLIYIVWQLVNSVQTDTFTKLTLGSTIMVGYDIFLEPVAMATNMWNWSLNTVPIQNYLAWFVVSFIFLWVFKMSNTNYNNPVASRLLAAQIVFFMLLNVVNQISGL